MGMFLDIQVDISDLRGKIGKLEANLTPQRFNSLMRSEFGRLPGRVRVIMKEDLPPNYYVKPSAAAAAVKGARMTGGLGGGGGVGCVIPIVGKKGNIGSMFGASGGAHGWNSLRRKYRVKAKIVKAGVSTLPTHMSHQGGQPPFRNLGSKLGGLTFTRKGKERGPIVRVSGIAIPQMPLNRSREAVEKDLHDYLEQRLDHVIETMLNV